MITLISALVGFALAIYFGYMLFVWVVVGFLWLWVFTEDCLKRLGRLLRLG